MNQLAKKLMIKPGKSWLFFNAPNNYFALLDPLPEDVTIFYNPSRQFDGVQLFVKDAAELVISLNIIAPTLKPDTIFWITYPKKSSGIKSDLEMMGSWDEVAKHGLRIVASAAIDDTWTALRFRPLGQSK
jgi:hypothetical protein